MAPYRLTAVFVAAATLLIPGFTSAAEWKFPSTDDGSTAEEGATEDDSGAGETVELVDEEVETEVVEEVSEPEPAVPTPTAPEFELLAHLDDGIFPSYVISSAATKIVAGEEQDANHIGDPDGNIGVLVRGVQANTPIKVEFVGEPYVRTTTFETKAPEGVTDIWITPKLKYDYSVLRQVTQVVPANISAKVWIAGNPLPEQTKVMKVHSVNEVVFGYQPSEDETYDYSYLFAGFVNENHPLIDELLKEALESEIVPAFVGYQAGDPDIVYAQAFAIWNALQRRGIKYSNITTTSTESDIVYSQHVRFLEQSVATKQANCVDGSVLFASALRKIGIRTFLVLVPGHMFVGWYTDEEGETAIGLETTMIGETNLSKFEKTESSKEKREKLINKESFAAFNAAVGAGTKGLTENKSKFFDEDELQYQMIDITEARKMGITPISYR
jgi:hypothetical protein